MSAVPQYTVPMGSTIIKIVYNGKYVNLCRLMRIERLRWKQLGRHCGEEVKAKRGWPEDTGGSGGRGYWR